MSLDRLQDAFQFLNPELQQDGGILPCEGPPVWQGSGGGDTPAQSAVAPREVGVVLCVR